MGLKHLFSGAYDNNDVFFGGGGPYFAVDAVTIQFVLTIRTIHYTVILNGYIYIFALKLKTKGVIGVGFISV
jgi:hypothetical protein